MILLELYLMSFGNVTLEALGRIDGSIERLELCEGTAVALRKKTHQ